MPVPQTTLSVQVIASLVLSTPSLRTANVNAIKDISLTNSESVQENVELMKNMIRLTTNVSVSKVLEKLVESVLFVLLDQNPLLTDQDAQVVKSTNNLLTDSALVRKDMLTTELEFVLFVLIFPMDSLSMEFVQSVPTI